MRLLLSLLQYLLLCPHRRSLHFAELDGLVYGRDAIMTDRLPHHTLLHTLLHTYSLVCRKRGHCALLHGLLVLLLGETSLLHPLLLLLLLLLHTSLHGLLESALLCRLLKSSPLWHGLLQGPLL